MYLSDTLTYRMFGFKGPLWMTQTCNDGSDCPLLGLKSILGALENGQIEGSGVNIRVENRFPAP